MSLLASQKINVYNFNQFLKFERLFDESGAEIKTITSTNYTLYEIALVLPHTDSGQ